MENKDQQDSFINRYKALFVILLVIASLALIALLSPKKDYPAVSAERLVIDPYLGAEDAPITIIEYADYACSGCKLWHNAGVLDEILTKFEDKVKFVWRDNAHISTASIAAANAAHCAYDQGKFWEYHDLLFANEFGFSSEGLKENAAKLGLDQDLFNTCVDQNTYYEKVFHNMKLAGERGLSVTPTFVVNDEIIIGPPPASYMEEVILKLLEE